MTNDERDSKINKIYDAVIPMVGKVQTHDEVLFGNGKPGMKEDIILLKERQEDCPARNANTAQGKRLVLANIMIVIAVITLIVNTALGVFAALKP